MVTGDKGKLLIMVFQPRRRGGVTSNRCDVHNLTYAARTLQSLPSNVVRQLWEVENAKMRQLFEQAERKGITITDGVRIEEM
jgi:hypothetical protein